MTVLGAVTRTHAHLIAAIMISSTLHKYSCPLYTLNAHTITYGNMAAERDRGYKGQRRKVSEKVKNKWR